MGDYWDFLVGLRDFFSKVTQTKVPFPPLILLYILKYALALGTRMWGMEGVGSRFPLYNVFQKIVERK